MYALPMSGADELQPTLPMDLPEPIRRERRRRRSRRVVRSHAAERTHTLLQRPVVQRCGLCGRRQPVLGDATVCEQCGGMIFRESDDEQQAMS